MRKFEPSAHAKLLSELDKHSGQTVEYWSKKKRKFTTLRQKKIAKH